MPAATTPVQARVSYGTRARLAEHLAAEKNARRALIAERFPVDPEAPAAQRARVRAEARAYLQGMRQRGELCDSVDVLMMHAVRAELGERGWDHPWPPPPPTAPHSGRWPGSLDGAWPEVIPIRLPAELAERLQAACANVSMPAIVEIRALRDANPGPITPADGVLWERYQALAAKVITPGDVLRAAVARALPHD
ncbi:hypothetical protein [Nonomuraea sediminis]|uniref:hypothetical protein n=1 Tax=Nonomuraea sediminis TaxID=2835864 RepID=UPI001BDC96D8|nr:hypothetical protein [Nonomuraea sediminis]